MQIDTDFLKKLRTMGIIEGISTLVLFGIAMPLKYLAGIPIAVRIAGSVHGFLFIALVLMFYIGIKRIPISTKLAIAGVVGAIFPFGSFIVDRWLDEVKDER